MKFLILSICFLSLCACSSVHHLNRKGVARIKTYHIYHKDIPQAFDRYTIAFVSDLHYKSILQEEGLKNVVVQISKMNPDLLLLGGDYKEGVDNINELFEYIGKIKTTDGIIGVLGNNDYEEGYHQILSAAKLHKIEILEDQCDTIVRKDAQIIIVGVKNPFDHHHRSTTPDASLQSDDYIVLLTHTPDYVEWAKPPFTDLALAGHTHGGQVTLFGLYAPYIPSQYGQRFRTGKCKTSGQIPVIVTNGIGTSRKNIRLFAPTEIVRLVLHHTKIVH